VKKLLSNTLNYENLLSVVTGLQDPHNRNAVAREQLVNASLESYISNMESCYPLYIDVCQPHVNALHMVSTTTLFISIAMVIYFISPRYVVILLFNILQLLSLFFFK